MIRRTWPSAGSNRQTNFHVFTLIQPAATFSLREKECIGSIRVDSREFAVQSQVPGYIFERALSRILRSLSLKLWMPCLEILSRIGSTSRLMKSPSATSAASTTYGLRPLRRRVAVEPAAESPETNRILGMPGKNRINPPFRTNIAT